jgi:hypothetical protein
MGVHPVQEVAPGEVVHGANDAAARVQVDIEAAQPRRISMHQK